MELIHFFPIAFIGLYIAYVNLMLLKNKIADKLPKFIQYILTYVLGVPFILLDVAFNVVYGSIMFIELPAFGNSHWKFLPTFTERCSRHLHNEWEKEHKSWRFRLAKAICKYMLEPWDYNHCGLEKLKDGVIKP